MVHIVGKASDCKNAELSFFIVIAIWDFKLKKNEWYCQSRKSANNNLFMEEQTFWLGERLKLGTSVYWLHKIKTAPSKIKDGKILTSGFAGGPKTHRGSAMLELHWVYSSSSQSPHPPDPGKEPRQHLLTGQIYNNIGTDIQLSIMCILKILKLVPMDDLSQQFHVESKQKLFPFDLFFIPSQLLQQHSFSKVWERATWVTG